MLQKGGCMAYLCPGLVVSEQVLNTAAPWRSQAVSVLIDYFVCLSLLLSQFDKEALVH